MNTRTCYVESIRGKVRLTASSFLLSEHDGDVSSAAPSPLIAMVSDFARPHALQGDWRDNARKHTPMVPSPSTEPISALCRIEVSLALHSPLAVEERGFDQLDDHLPHVFAATGLGRLRDAADLAHIHQANNP